LQTEEDKVEESSSPDMRSKQQKNKIKIKIEKKNDSLKESPAGKDNTQRAGEFSLKKLNPS